MTAAIHHHRFFHHVDAVTLHQLLEQIEDLFCPGTLECKDPWVDNQNSNSLGINCTPRSRRRGDGLMKAQSYYFPCQHRFLWLIFKKSFIASVKQLKPQNCVAQRLCGNPFATQRASTFGALRWRLCHFVKTWASLFVLHICPVSAINS